MTESEGRIEAIIFDAYGTLFETQSVIAALAADMPQHADFLTQIWRLKQLEYSWLRTAGDDYADFGVVTRDALRFSVGSLDLAVDDAQLENWASADDRLTPCRNSKPGA